MGVFKWVAVTYAIVLGLGVARLLSAAVDVFRSRRHAQLDWIPFAWAGTLFLWQLQFWWAIIELPQIMQVWSLGDFLILLTLTLLLFVAAALILPGDQMKPGDSLSKLFHQDGRWALVCLSTYFLLAIFADWFLWDQTPFSYFGALLFALAALPILYLKIPSRRGQEILTIVFVVLSIWTAIELSPASYQ